MSGDSERQNSEAANARATVDDGQSDGRIRSVVRAVEILAKFDEDTLSWTVSDLARATGLPKTTLVRMVDTLEQTGMLWMRPDGQVTVGAGLLRWAKLARAAWELPAPVLDAMRGLADECGETTSFYVRQGPFRVCVAQQEGRQSLRQVVRVGDKLPMWAGASSKLLLTAASDEDVAEIAASSPYGPGYTPQLLAEVEKIRAAGHVVTHGERENGVSGIAAPIRGGTGDLIAALALGGPTARFTPDRIPKLVTAVTAAANWVSSLRLAATFPPPENS
ncbi:IclR family transcriptional regulator [Actinoalloteichus hymeniacidonis]|uniref:Transcriptional regulator, IclR family n=1 Tax=Actinoalloteichus hymeniacidonis TaxID=340345 RepID=A0AAC9HV82_9PSEU|nr:IclR family transcriptional regulator [Actinoalloteichus hymeniacidonis]AOS65935.1 transcriptional regulator, IclR family [Actinoalloteichus hymeniacidonis]MBB5905969.1 DNA-binding IclR family transcriptional regulator [Actinoalloteichus hymeniacidonis]